MRRLWGLCLAVVFLCGGCAMAAELPTEPVAAHPHDVTLATAPTASPRPEETPTPEPTTTPEPTPDPNIPPAGAFSAKDVRVADISLLSDAQGILADLGEPALREENLQQVSGETYSTLAYDGLFLAMSGGRLLTSATVTSADWLGPRDLRVGQSLESVLNAFGLAPPTADEGEKAEDGEGESEEEAEAVLYARRLAGDEAAYPPLCAVDFTTDENEEYVVRMLCPLDPYEDSALRSGSYLFARHAVFLLYFDAEDELTRMSLQVGPLEA